MANKRIWLGMLAMVLAFGIIGTASLAAQETRTTIPDELRGTWVRTGATSGRAFDTTLTITADRMVFTYSDGRPAEMFSFELAERIVNVASTPGNHATNRAQEFPAGWRLFGIEDGRDFVYGFFLNAANNRFTQAGTADTRDIWVRR